MSKPWYLMSADGSMLVTLAPVEQGGAILVGHVRLHRDRLRELRDAINDILGEPLAPDGEGVAPVVES